LDLAREHRLHIFFETHRELPDRVSLSDTAEGEGYSMMDAVFLLLSVALFYAAIRYTKWSDRV